METLGFLITKATGFDPVRRVRGPTPMSRSCLADSIKILLDSDGIPRSTILSIKRLKENLLGWVGIMFVEERMPFEKRK